MKRLLVLVQSHCRRRSPASAHREPAEVVADRAPAHVVDELLPGALHTTEQYANNRVEADHGRLKARLRPMRGLKSNRYAIVVMRGHALVQNSRRGHYELGTDTTHALRLASAFDGLQVAI